MSACFPAAPALAALLAQPLVLGMAEAGLERRSPCDRLLPKPGAACRGGRLGAAAAALAAAGLAALVGGESGALVGVGDGGETITPGVLFGEGALPQLLGRGEGFGLPLLARFPVDGVDALAVAGVGEAQSPFTARDECGCSG